MLNSPKTTPIWVGFYLFLASGTEHQTWMWGLPSKITVQLDKPPYIIYIYKYIHRLRWATPILWFFLRDIYETTGWWGYNRTWDVELKPPSAGDQLFLYVPEGVHSTKRNVQTTATQIQQGAKNEWSTSSNLVLGFLTGNFGGGMSRPLGVLYGHRWHWFSIHGA